MLWASAFPAIRVGLPGLGVAGLSVWRLVFASIALAAMAPLFERDFDEAADLARLTRAQRNFLWHRQILNPHAKYGYTAGQ